jgi:hypothetical protein
VRPARLITFGLLALVALAALGYTGIWQMFVLFLWQHPMLSWMPILTVVVVATLFKLATALWGGNLPEVAGSRMPRGPSDLGSGEAGEIGMVDLAEIQDSRPSIEPRSGVHGHRRPDGPARNRA